MATIAERVAALERRAAEDDEKKPVDPAAAPGDRCADPDDPDKPAEPAPAPAPADPAPAPAPAEPASAPDDPDKPDDGDDDEAKKALAELAGRIAAQQTRIDALEAEVGRLRGMARDPALAAARLSTAPVAGSAAEAAPAASRAELEKRYAALTSPKERAEFRRAHAKELGLARG